MDRATKNCLPPVVDDFFGLQLSEALLLFFHRVNPEGDFDSLSLSGSTQDTPDSPSRETSPANEHGNIAMI